MSPRSAHPLLLLVLLVACDDGKPPTADTNGRPPDMHLDAPPSDLRTGVEATPERDTLSDAPTDRSDSGRKLGQGCCAPSASACTLGVCESGLTCFVVSNGPYLDRGICSKPCSNPITDCACPPNTPGSLCPGGTPTCEQGQCMWLCLPGSQGCDSSQPCKCAAGLLCLSASGRNLCLPAGG